jgi:hypothetical protein
VSLLCKKDTSIEREKKRIIKEIDYYLLPDVVIDENKLNATKLYRQLLRDFIKSATKL